MTSARAMESSRHKGGPPRCAVVDVLRPASEETGESPTPRKGGLLVAAAADVVAVSAGYLVWILG